MRYVADATRRRYTISCDQCQTREMAYADDHEDPVWTHEWRTVRLVGQNPDGEDQFVRFTFDTEACATAYFQATVQRTEPLTHWGVSF